MIKTKNLTIRHLNITDADFILRLTNDPDWLTFIGDKGIRSVDDAVQYIQNGPMAMYQSHGFGLYFVGLNDSETPVGICGILKRDSLEHPDLGFAFLPEFRGKGFAFESAEAVLAHAKSELKLKKILAITLPNNERSKHLLKKAGFQFSHQKAEKDYFLDVFEYIV